MHVSVSAVVESNGVTPDTAAAAAADGPLSVQSSGEALVHSVQASAAVTPRDADMDGTMV